MGYLLWAGCVLQYESTQCVLQYESTQCVLQYESTQCVLQYESTQCVCCSMNQHSVCCSINQHNVCCSINQHSVHGLDILDNLRLVVSGTQATLLVLDPQALPLTRLWCLYESWITVEQEGAGKLVLVGVEDLDLEASRETYDCVNAALAMCSLEGDRDR
jgi:hypothetical protein